MAHYAILDENNVVTQVFVGKDEGEDGIDWEQYYKAKRTSYNTFGGKHKSGGVPFRKNYAGIGFTYDSVRDAFIPPKPFKSWHLDEDSCLWIAPAPMPLNKACEWSEENLAWVEI